jgi:hypothetical protein
VGKPTKAEVQVHLGNARYYYKSRYSVPNRMATLVFTFRVELRFIASLDINFSLLDFKDDITFSIPVCASSDVPGEALEIHGQI